MAAAVLAAALMASPMTHATPNERHFLKCVKQHESGNYTAQNPTSTASGAYQFIDATWRGNARWAKWKGTYPARGYAKAKHAPKWIQDLVALHAIRHGGAKAWIGTGCNYRGRGA